MLKFHPLDVLEGLRPFTDQHGRSCVQFLDYGATAVLPIRSPQFRDFYDARFFDRTQSIPPLRERNNAIRHLESSIEPEHRAFVVSRRIAADHPTKPSAIALD